MNKFLYGIELILLITVINVDISYGQSDQVFLICPNGGEELFWDSTYTIRWSFSPPGPPNIYDYILSLSTDGGQSYPYPITGVVNPDSGTMEWIIPQISSTTCRVLIQVDSAGVNVGWDVSDGNFTISETGIEENGSLNIPNTSIGSTIFSGPLQLPEGKNCKVFDITGRVVILNKIKPGIYFIEIDGKITKKVVKVR
ncbi:MAG: T9SS type A sorting domain-containing protein [bacterium]